MSDNTNDGGPAFPRAPFDVNDYTGDGSPGMSLRDYFAGQALNGLISRFTVDGVHGWPNFNYEELTVRAYSIADAMLAARKNGGTT